MAAEYQKERSCHYALPAGCLMMNYLQSLSEWHLSLSECHWVDTQESRVKPLIYLGRLSTESRISLQLWPLSFHLKTQSVLALL
jgi:hypothetical protein